MNKDFMGKFGKFLKTVEISKGRVIYVADEPFPCFSSSSSQTSSFSDMNRPSKVKVYVVRAENGKEKGFCRGDFASNDMELVESDKVNIIRARYFGGLIKSTKLGKEN